MMRLMSLAVLAWPGLAMAQSTAERLLIEEVFAIRQPISMRENVEYCGYVGFDADSILIASDGTRGDESSCLPEDPADIELITASWHSHGAFSRDYFNEVPSVSDVEGDEADGIDGYVATPGGRLWYIDTGDMVISQLCGIGCLPSDPAFRPGDMGRIETSYSYHDLVEILE